MFFFVLKVVIVSIFVSLFATWIELIPRYKRRWYNFVQQLINAVLLSIVLTFLEVFRIDLSWLLLFALIVLVVWLSVWLTDRIVRRGEKSDGESRE